MDTKSLMHLGLSKCESEAYFALLQLPEATASVLSSKTNESRTNTYDTLNALIKKGLVSYIMKNNIKYFIASNPSKIIDWLDLKKQEVNNQLVFVENIMPKLSAIKKQNQKKVQIEIYEGLEGARTVLNETILNANETNKEILMLNSLAGKLRETDPIYHKRYYKEKEKAKIKTRYIFVSGENPPIAPKSEYRFLPSSYKSLVTTGVHGNAVSFWFYVSSWIIVLIKNKELADTYKSNFEVLWKIAKTQEVL